MLLFHHSRCSKFPSILSVEFPLKMNSGQISIHSLNFPSSILISFLFLQGILLDAEFQVDSYFFQCLKKVATLLPSVVSDEKSTDIGNVSFTSGYFPFLFFLEDFFFPCLWFSSLSLCCLGTDFIGFILFQVHSASYIFSLWKFSVIMYFKNFFQYLTLPLFLLGFQ